MAMLYLRNKPIGAISDGASGGGHVIENTSGTDMEQRSDLQFVGVYTEDDSANDRTKVNVVRTMTKAQMDALSAEEKVGFIRTSDEADNPYLALAPKAISVSDFMTLESGVTFRGIIYEFCGMIAIAGYFAKTGLSGMNVKVATINSDYRTATSFQFSCTGYQSSHVYAASGTMQNGGNLYLSCDNSVGEISLDFTYKKG